MSNTRFKAWFKTVGICDSKVSKTLILVVYELCGLVVYKCYFNLSIFHGNLMLL